MGKPVTSDAQRFATTALNTKVNKKVFEDFKDCCKKRGYPMNVMLETFMLQYANGRFNLRDEHIIKWKKDEWEQDTLNTTFNKEIYQSFKATCKNKGFFVKHVIIAFMDIFAKENLILEYVDSSSLVYEQQNDSQFGVDENDIKIMFWTCPQCGKKFEAIADNWCVKKFSEEGKNWVVCRENCGHV